MSQPKWMFLTDVLKEFFSQGTNLPSPFLAHCKCGYIVHSMAGAAIHVKKEHNIFVIRNRDKNREKIKRILQSREGVNYED